MTKTFVVQMASSDDNKLVKSCRDFVTINSQHNVKLPVDTNCRYSLKSSALSFRQLYIIGTLFVIVMGFLSKPYLESPLHVIMYQRFDPLQVESFPKYHNTIDAAASDRSMKIFEDDEVKLSSSPSQMASAESAQEAESRVEKNKEYASPLLEDSAIGDDKDVKEKPLVPPVRQDGIHRGEGKSISDIDEQDSAKRFSSPLNANSTQQQEKVQMQQQVEGTKISLADHSITDSAKNGVSIQENEKPIKLLRNGLPQEETPRKRGKDKETENLDQAQIRHRSRRLSNLLTPQ